MNLNPNFPQDKCSGIILNHMIVAYFKRFLFILLNVYDCFACMHVSVPHECLLESLELGLRMVVINHKWLLGIETPMYFIRATGSLNHWFISIAPQVADL